MPSNRVVMSSESDLAIRSQPVYLVAGNLTKDIVSSGWRLGGSVAYCSLASRRLNVRTHVITGHGPDVSTGDVFDGIATVIEPSRATTTFRNTEREGIRRQVLIEKGDALTGDFIPDEWRSPDVLHLAPIFREISSSFVTSFRPRLTGATVQGWMRAAGEGGTIVFGTDQTMEEMVKYVDIAVFSDHDMNNNSKLRRMLIESIPVCVETIGSKGCNVLEKGREHFVGTPAHYVRDTTGAGDVFATALFLRFIETGDPVRSAQFANEFAGAMLTDPNFRTRLENQGQGTS